MKKNKEVRISLWAITNRGGELLKPLNYFGYRVPTYFTKKEAIAAKIELDKLDTATEIKKRQNGFVRKIVKLYVRYSI